MVNESEQRLHEVTSPTYEVGQRVGDGVITYVPDHHACEPPADAPRSTRWRCDCGKEKVYALFGWSTVMEQPESEGVDRLRLRDKLRSFLGL